MNKSILKMDNISKSFPGVKALDNVSFCVDSNNIHAVVGENGAGKSTLMKIISGVYSRKEYEGDFYFNNELCIFNNIKDSESIGIVIIHQEFTLIPTLSIMENMFLGNPQAINGIIDWNLTRKKCLEYMKMVGLDENPESLVSDIGIGKQQLIEIAKALAKNVKLLILDEPTASLTESDSENLLKLLLRLKNEHGITSILISHKLNEVLEVSDAITIIRDGAVIKNLDKTEADENTIIKHMVGRELESRFPERVSNIGETFIEIRDWTIHDEFNTDRVVIDKINFNAKKGEVVGIYGLMGSGRTELAMSIFGRSHGQYKSGEIYINGEHIIIDSVKSAILNGVGYVTEDRKGLGLILEQDIRKNITLSNLSKISNKTVIDKNKEIRDTNNVYEKVGIKAPSVYEVTGNLSGGNQQKVMLSRWIYSDVDILILDEPTRGIDVGSKYEIYKLMNELLDLGKTIIMISSELPEILGMSDRIYVMNDGRIVEEFDIENANQELIMKSILSSKGEIEDD